MGLDMYLEAKWTVALYDPQTEPVRRAISTAIGYIAPRDKPGQDASLLEVSGVTVRVGYWQQFDPLHQWFVSNVLESYDDCRPAYVSPEVLAELEEQVDRVRNDPESASKYFASEDGAPVSEGDMDYTLKVIMHAKRLQESGWDITYRASW